MRPCWQPNQGECSDRPIYMCACTKMKKASSMTTVHKMNHLDYNDYKRRVKVYKNYPKLPKSEQLIKNKQIQMTRCDSSRYR